MHYYQFNIADFRKDTGHLSLLERGIYRELLDWYYLDEKPIPLETQWVNRRFPSNESHVLTILGEFFQKTDEGWHHRRVDLEINNYRHNVEKNRTNGKLGGRPKKNPWVNLANPNVTQVKANQEPITNNQEPSKPKRSVAASRLPADRELTDEWRADAAKIRPDWINGTVDRVFEGFRDYWISKAGKDAAKADWQATWRNWCRRDSTQSTPRPGYKPSGRQSAIDNYAAEAAAARGENNEFDIDGQSVRVA